MVCLGNICRSPLAEGILKYKVQQYHLNWFIDSAGTEPYHVGEAPHPLSQKIALLNGIDICNQRARQFSANDIYEFDKIYALATDVLNNIKYISGNLYTTQKVCLLMDEVYPSKQMDVPDPWYGPEDGYHKAFQMIDEACNIIIKKYSPNEQ